MAPDPKPPTRPDAPAQPPELGLPEHYRVWQRDDGSWWQLGRGSVYKATDLRTDETVALRFFGDGPHDFDVMGDLAEYVSLLARPGSPLVPPLRDFFASGSFHVAATEFVPGESLTERVRRDGPLPAERAWTVARQLLEALGSLHALGIAHDSVKPSKILFPGDVGSDTPLRLVAAGLHPSASVALDPAAGSDATREDLYQLGATVWFALTGEALFAAPSGFPLPWTQFDAAQMTPARAALSLLLTWTLTGEPMQRPPTAVALMAMLNMLESPRFTVPPLSAMSTRAFPADPVTPTAEERPPTTGDAELWTYPPGRLVAPKRRRGGAGMFWLSLLMLAVGGAAGFVSGVMYEKHVLQADGAAAQKNALASTPAALASANPTAAPTPAIPLLSPQSVSPAGVTARLERIKKLQPDTGDVLKYARELVRVATVPVADLTNFPADDHVAQLLQRFDWNDPASPHYHHTPLLLILGYSRDPSAEQSRTDAQQLADMLAQKLAHGGITSPIYACGLGSADGVPEVQPTGVPGAQFVEVWVGYTLF